MTPPAPIFNAKKTDQAPTLTGSARLLAAVCLCLGLARSLPGAVSSSVIVDQVGYLPTETKYGMVTSTAATGAFSVCRASDGVVVLSGTLAASFTDAASGDKVRTADFSSLTATGSYYLNAAGVGQSYNFAVDPNAFVYSYYMAGRGFYAQRCGMAVNMGTVDGVTYDHASCHSSGAATDLPATYHPSSGKSGTLNSAKGWHDAGDYGKYIVNAGISTGELLWTYEWFSDRVGAVSLAIPESGNGTPDVLNEARWELDWMLTMQDTDGGVWHKLTSAGFGSFVLPEDDDAGTRYVIGTGPGSGAAPYKTSCSTADFAAVMAIAARLYQPFDPAFAATCLAAAENAWTWVSANPTVYYTQPSSGPAVSTGGYGDGDSSDERLWAAAELFHTTGLALYNTYVTANAPTGTLISGANLPQDWGDLQDLAIWTYYFSGQATANAALLTRIKADTLNAANTIAAYTSGGTNGYKVSLGTGQYIWGSNGAVANYGLLLLAANRMSPSATYTNAALDDLHYILGRNAWNKSFVTHLGSNPVMHPHHRPSGSPQYSALAPWPGLMSGGPNSTGNGADGLTPASPFPAKCYVDTTLAYASNEVAINWQAPLVFLLAWCQPVPATPTPTPSPTASPTRTATRTPTASPTASATPSATRSASPTATPSASPSPTASPSRTATASPSLSPSPSGTRSASPSPSASMTASPSPSASLTASPSPSPTPSATPSPAWTPTPSPTVTPPYSATGTGTATASATPTTTPSVTLTATPTASPSTTATATGTALPSAVPTATLTANPSRTASPWPSASVTPTPSATASGTPGLTTTATPGAAGGGRLLQALPVPQPLRGAQLGLALQLDAPADGVELRIYSHALVLEAVVSATEPLARGWDRVSMVIPRLAGGVHFFRAAAINGGRPGKAVLGRLVVLP